MNTHLGVLIRSAIGAGIAAISISSAAVLMADNAGAATAYSAPPASVSGWQGVSQFGTDGNIVADDCSLAAIATLQQVWSAELGGSGVAMNASSVIDTYRSSVQNNNQGLLPSQAFADWETGIGGAKIDAVGSIATSQASVEQAIWQLGGIFAVINIDGNDAQHVNVPNSQIGHTGAWSLIEPTVPGAFGLEPHSVAVVGYNQRYVYLATWGTVQPVTWAWWNARVVQTWALLPDNYFTAGKGPVSKMNYLQQTFFNVSAAPQVTGPYAN